MRKIMYIAVLEPVPSGYSVYFPDLPGCTSAGVDLSEAWRILLVLSQRSAMAAEALSIFLYEMEHEGEQLPIPAKSGYIETYTPGSLLTPVTYSPIMRVAKCCCVP